MSGPPRRVFTRQARVGAPRGALPWHGKAGREEGTVQRKEAGRPEGISDQGLEGPLCKVG